MKSVQEFTRMMDEVNSQNCDREPWGMLVGDIGSFFTKTDNSRSLDVITQLIGRKLKVGMRYAAVKKQKILAPQHGDQRGQSFLVNVDRGRKKPELCYFKTRPDPRFWTYISLRSVIACVVTDMAFKLSKYDGKVMKQNQGAPIGSPLGDPIASAAALWSERQFPHKKHSVYVSSRYVDDKYKLFNPLKFDAARDPNLMAENFYGGDLVLELDTGVMPVDYVGAVVEFRDRGRGPGECGIEVRPIYHASSRLMAYKSWQTEKNKKDQVYGALLRGKLYSNEQGWRYQAKATVEAISNQYKEAGYPSQFVDKISKPFKELYVAGEIGINS